MRTLLAMLAIGLAGCSGFGRPALLVEMNGRQVGFDRFETGKVPRGVEVTEFTPSTLRVRGESPIQVNGVEVYAAGQQMSIGGRKITIDDDAQVIVRKDGAVDVRLPQQAAAPQATPPQAAK